jgi:hypothetical protein
MSNGAAGWRQELKCALYATMDLTFRPPRSSPSSDHQRFADPTHFAPGLAQLRLGRGVHVSGPYADLVLKNLTTGARAIWLLKNCSYSSALNLPNSPGSWHIAGVGDLLGNGQSDLVWEIRLQGSTVSGSLKTAYFSTASAF